MTAVLDYFGIEYNRGADNYKDFLDQLFYKHFSSFLDEIKKRKKDDNSSQ